MQKKLFLSLLTVVVILLSGCTNPALIIEEKKVIVEKNKENGTNPVGIVKFSWNSAHYSSFNHSASAPGPFEVNLIQAAKKVVITIEKEDGREIINNKQLVLYHFSGSFISESVSLQTGSYKLTEYLVLDETGKVIFAAPKKGSKKAPLVNQPLPIVFSVAKDSTTREDPEVLDVEETPAENFGYAASSLMYRKPLTS